MLLCRACTLLNVSRCNGLVESGLSSHDKRKWVGFWKHSARRTVLVLGSQNHPEWPTIVYTVGCNWNETTIQESDGMNNIRYCVCGPSVEW